MRNVHLQALQIIVSLAHTLASKSFGLDFGELCGLKCWTP